MCRARYQSTGGQPPVFDGGGSGQPTRSLSGEPFPFLLGQELPDGALSVHVSDPVEKSTMTTGTPPRATCQACCLSLTTMRPRRAARRGGRPGGSRKLGRGLTDHRRI